MSMLHRADPSVASISPTSPNKPRASARSKQLLLILAAVMVAVSISDIIFLRSRPPVTALSDTPVLPSVAPLHELRELARADLRSAPLHLALAQQLLGYRQYLSAIAEFDRALANGADEATVLTGRSKANIALERYDLAEADVVRLIHLRPNVLETSLALAEVRQQGDDEKGAEAALAAIPILADGMPAAEGHQDRLEGAELLATAYSHLGRWDKTLEWTRKCLLKEPDRASSRIMLGKTLHATRKYAEAVPYLQGAIKFAPKTAELWYLLGTAYQGRNSTGDSDRASICLQRAVLLDNRHGAATLAVAREAERRKAFGAAAFAYERAYKLGMEGPQLLFKSGEMMAKSGNKEESWYRKGLFYEAAGRPDLAAAEYMNLTKLHDSCRSGYIHLARAMTQMGRNDQALAYLREAQKRSPARAKELFWSIVDVMGHNKQDAPRMKMLEEVAREPGHDGEEAGFQLAKLNDSVGKHAEAEKWYRSCVAAEPADPIFHLELGRFLLTQRGDPARLAEATRELEAAVKLAPENRDAVYGLGMAYFYSSRLDSALLTLRHAVDLQPESGEGYQSLALVLSRMGNRQEAAEVQAAVRRFEEVNRTRETLAARCKRDPTNPSTQLRMAEFHMWAHEYLAAIERYRKVLMLQPHNGAARARLAEALGAIGKREQQRAVLAGMMEPKELPR